MQTSLTEKELQAYGSAGAICEEVLTAIRTVVAFGGEEKETKRCAEPKLKITIFVIYFQFSDMLTI